MTDLSGLLARVTEATGPDERLAVEILEAFDIASYITEEGDPTASIDAAMWLVETTLPGWDRYVRIYASGPPAFAWLSRPTVTDAGDAYFEAHAATGPLAILAALLRAKIGASS